MLLDTASEIGRIKTCTKDINGTIVSIYEHYGFTAKYFDRIVLVYVIFILKPISCVIFSLLKSK